MADSNITLSNVQTYGGAGLIVLTWTTIDPNEQGLQYLSLDQFEVWASYTNTRSAATKVTEGRTSAVHPVTQYGSVYYWFRARDKSGNLGDFYPASDTAGIVGSTIFNLFVRSLAVYEGGMLISGGEAPLVILADGAGSAIAAFSTGSSTKGIGSLISGAAKYAFYATATGGATGYGPFTGAHDALISKDECIEEGDVVCDRRIVSRFGLSETVSEIEIAATANQQNVIGVLSGRASFSERDRLSAFNGGIVPEELTRLFDRAVVNALGEGQINVCGANGPIEAGDLLVASDVPGKAMRQDDDIVRSCTVAKARESADVWMSGDRAQIACIYLCG